MFKYNFMQNALAAGVLVGIVCSVLSVFVVLRKMAFIGQGIAHAAFGGIALALLFDLDLFFTTAIFCSLIAVLIGVVSRGEKKVSEDSSIGLFLTTSMALGVILLKLKKGYTPEVFGYLFGDILTVSSADVIKIAVMGVLVLGFIIIYYRQLQFFTFDEEMAKVTNVPTTFLYYMLLIILSLVIVMSVQVVGVVLVTALLVVPATTALLIGRRFLPVLLMSVAVGIFSTFSGLSASYLARLPSGAVIVAALFAIFSLVWLAKKMLKI